MRGEPPFKSKKYKKILKLNKKCDIDYDVDAFRDLSKECLDILSKMLDASPVNRPTAAECLAHPWFTAQKTILVESPPKNELKMALGNRRN